MTRLLPKMPSKLAKVWLIALWLQAFSGVLLSQPHDLVGESTTSPEEEVFAFTPGCLNALQALDEEIQSILNQYPGWSCGVEEVTKRIPAAIRQRPLEAWKQLASWLDGIDKNPSQAARQLLFWGRTTHTIFVACAPLHWEDFTSVWLAFQSLEAHLAELPEHVSLEIRTKALLPVARYFLHTRLSPHHLPELLPWIEASTRRVAQTNSRSIQAEWMEILAFSSLALIGPEENDRAERLSNQWLQEFLQQGSISSHHRLFVAHMHAMAYHTYARSDDALTQLEWIGRLEPAARSHPGLLSQHFFVLHSGMGDRLAARGILDEFDQLIASGTLEPEDDTFQFITDTYYKTLPLDEISFRRLIAQARNPEQTNTTP